MIVTGLRCPALCGLALHCRYVSTDITGDQYTTTFAAVSVTPCDAACG